MRDTRHKRSHIVWFNFYELSKDGKSEICGDRTQPGTWDGGVTAAGCKVSFDDDGNIPKLDRGHGCMVL